MTNQCRRSHAGCAAALTALLLGACTDRAAQETKAPAAKVSTVAEATKVAPPAAPAAPVAALEPNLAVEGEGLRLFVGANASARPLPFGTPRQQLLEPLERYRGPADTGTQSECGAGPLDYAVWADGLKLYFQDDKFAGWALDGRAEGAHSTAAGIGPGSTRRELEAAYQVKVEQTSLGTEFSAGSLFGVLDGPGNKARISDMWAGVSCVFR